MKILRVRQVSEKTGDSVAQIWRKNKSDPDFPKAVRISEAVTGWIESEIDAYLERKVREFRNNPTSRPIATIAARVSAQQRAIKKATTRGGGQE